MRLILPPNGTRHDGASRFYVLGLGGAAAEGVVWVLDYRASVAAATFTRQEHVGNHADSAGSDCGGRLIDRRSNQGFPPLLCG